MAECFLNSTIFTKLNKSGFTRKVAKRIKCSTCLMEISITGKRTHVLHHIEEDNPDFEERLFRCLICPNNNLYFKTNYEHSIFRHLKFRHKVKPMFGYNYASGNNKLKIMKEAEKLLRICFKGQLPYYPNDKIKSEKNLVTKTGEKSRLGKRKK